MYKVTIRYLLKNQLQLKESKFFRFSRQFCLLFDQNLTLFRPGPDRHTVLNTCSERNRLMKYQVVSFRCVLKNKLGKVLSSTVNHDVLTGQQVSGSQLPGLANALQNLTEGEYRRVDLNASEAYGFYDPSMVIKVPKTDLPDATERRNEHRPIMLDFKGNRKAFRIVEIGSESIILDGNHPLAGQDLVFEIETTAVRDATPEEISESVDHTSEPMVH